MPLTRRQLLKRTGALTGGLLGSGFFGSPFMRKALAETLGDRYFVAIYLESMPTPFATNSLLTTRRSSSARSLRRSR